MVLEWLNDLPSKQVRPEKLDDLCMKSNEILGQEYKKDTSTKTMLREGSGTRQELCLQQWNTLFTWLPNKIIAFLVIPPTLCISRRRFSKTEVARLLHSSKKWKGAFMVQPYLQVYFLAGMNLRTKGYCNKLFVIANNSDNHVNTGCQGLEKVSGPTSVFYR